MRLAGASLCVVAAAALAACGGGSNGSTTAAAPLTLDQRLLKPGDVSGRLAPGPKQRLTGARPAAVRMNGVLIHPKQTAAQLRRAHFAVLLGQQFRSLVKGTPNKPPTGPGGELDSIVIRVGSPAAATSLLSWMSTQAEQPCPGTCDVRIQEFTPGGIADSRGVERSRATRTAGGAPFDLNIVGFANGPFVYIVSAGGEPGAFPRDKVVGDAQKLYDRVRGAPSA